MITHEGLIYLSCVFRCFGFMLSLPCGETLQNVPRFLIAVGLGVTLGPTAVASPQVSSLSPLIDFVIGFALGAPLRYVADVSEMVGELIDTARGQTISSVIDPLHGQGGSDLAIIAKLGAIVCALHLGALEVSLEGLARSTQVIPLGGSVVEPSLALGLVRSMSFVVVEGMRVCAVWMGAFLLVDTLCAFSTRLLTGLSFTQAAGLIKMLVTFLLVMVVITDGGRLSRSELSRILVPWREVSSAPASLVGLPTGRAGSPPPATPGEVGR